LAFRLMTGNEALALGALHAGIKVAAGYPGTPSTGALESLLALPLKEVHVEWSANEKVAFEIAAGAAWAGQRALCTMKMSGLNVAYDSLISAAYSGVVGGLVIYVADDPGVSAGMAEQDSRGFALMSDLPMLEPASPAEAYRLTKTAFEISERAGTPVFVRLVTSVASSSAAVDVDDSYAGPPERKPVLLHDINRFTKAGSIICMNQHRDLITRLEKAGQHIKELGLNRLELAARRGGLGIAAAGAAVSYLDEGLEIASRFGLDAQIISTLKIPAVNPFPVGEAQALLQHCETILILEELEPYIERGFYVQAQRMGYHGRLIGKIDGQFERVGEYGVRHVVEGIAAALDLQIPPDLFQGYADAEALAAARPITVCAGCPHRGTFMAIDRAIRKSGFRREEVMVTGDIGCTILGMNPPFNTVWNELSMGASIGLAMGFAHSDVQTPVIATIGDSTFFHAGLPALVTAVQHQVPLTVIIMDNGWTSMTGMQVNPGTQVSFQQSGNRNLDIARIVPALGVDQFFVIDPFDLDDSAEMIRKAIKLPGVKVVLSRQECIIPAMRRGVEAGRIRVIAENCNLCKLCIIATGCPAISLGEDTVIIDPEQCYGCNLCGAVCNRDAIMAESGMEVPA
jgi:indolepyruvate ferredoxin oxidoreductase, alpha subunit